jgi:hypothetical protein
MRVDADSIMKYWPAFLRRLAQPFFPKNVLYYDSAPPHHLVKFVDWPSVPEKSSTRSAILRPVNEERRGLRGRWMAGAVNTIGQSKRGGGDRSSRPA